MHELVQPGERKLGFSLDPARAQHPHPRRVPDRVPEQRRLADTGLATNHQCAAARGPGASDEALDSSQLGLSAEKHTTIVARPRWTG